MTTIAYRNGILATDTQMVIDDSRKTNCTKIRRLNDHTIIACAGDVNNEVKAQRYFSNPDWIKEDPPPMTKKEFECILIYNDKPYFCFSALYPSPIESEYFAIGSGAPYAIAAMARGDSAIEAIKFASTIDVHTNDVVQTYNVMEHNETPKGRKAKKQE